MWLLALVGLSSWAVTMHRLWPIGDQRTLDHIIATIVRHGIAATGMLGSIAGDTGKIATRKSQRKKRPEVERFFCAYGVAMPVCLTCDC